MRNNKTTSALPRDTPTIQSRIDNLMKITSYINDLQLQHFKFLIAKRFTLFPIGIGNICSAPTSGLMSQGCVVVKLGRSHPSDANSSSSNEQLNCA